MATPDTGDEYDTKLTPQEEAEFRRQYPDQGVTHDYDMRGAFKAGVTPDPVTGHLPDTFKKPNHITFSDESVYHGKKGNVGGHWEQSPDGRWHFTARPTNLQNYGAEQLNNYFNEHEKDSTLSIPGEE